jgi:hypothetical protein
MPARAQDAAAVDAKHYQVEFENDQVRAHHLRTAREGRNALAPGRRDRVTECLARQFTLPGGKTQDVAAKAGTAQWTEPSVHLPEHVGDKACEVIQVELKTRPAHTAKKK